MVSIKIKFSFLIPDFGQKDVMFGGKVISSI